MLIDKDDSLMIVVDIQEKLAPKIKDIDNVLAKASWLLKAAGLLSVPVWVAEQYPQGLGKTIGPILSALPPKTPIIPKVSFSCIGEQAWVDRLKKHPKNQIILLGIETHVCILQTAIELLEAGHEVFVVVDAVSSRQALDHDYALDRMNGEGVRLVTTEMVAFEWLASVVGTPAFKAIQRALFT